MVKIKINPGYVRAALYLALLMIIIVFFALRARGC